MSRLQNLANVINECHIAVTNKCKDLVAAAIEIGHFLAKARLEISHTGNFTVWLQSEIKFSATTAYRYLDLYKYQTQIARARNLVEAYKIIDEIQSGKKKTETQKARERIEIYRRTGSKPEGWRRHTDDKLAQEEPEYQNAQAERQRNAAEQKRIETAERLKRLQEEIQKEQEKSKRNENFISSLLLGTDILDNPDTIAFLNFLADKADDNRRIETCNLMIKIGKRISAQLQSRNAQTQTA